MKEKKSIIFSDVAAEYIKNDETDAFTLMTIALHFLGDELFELSPPVVFNELEKICSVRMPEENENKINAAITVITTDLYQHNLQVFKSVTAAFDDGDIDDVLDGDEDFSPCQIMWGIYQAGLLIGKDLTPEDFSEDVKEYLMKTVNTFFGGEEDQSNDSWVDSYINLRVVSMCTDLYKLIGNKDHVIKEILDQRGLDMREIA